MAPLTQFFGLTKLTPSDPPSSNNYAFQLSNIDTIDRLLYKLHNAVFVEETPIADPVEGPSLVVDTSGGNIRAGVTVRYKFTWVDQYGSETAASNESFVSTPAPVSAPGAPGVQFTSSGGSLLAGTYFYRLSAYTDVNTLETLGGSTISITIPSGSTNSVTLTLPNLPGGADGFNVYRRGPGESNYYYIASIDMTVATPPTSYVDNGSQSPNCNRSPAQQNLTNSKNAITVTLPGATPSVPDGYTWKVYRTFSANDWNQSLLEWVTTETSSGSGVIVPYIVDTGQTALPGSPPTTSTITGDTSRIDAWEGLIDDIEQAIDEIRSQLGATPEGIYDSVQERLDVLEQLIESATPGGLDDIYSALSILYSALNLLDDEITTARGGYVSLDARLDDMGGGGGGGGITWGTVVDTGLGNDEAFPGWYDSTSATPSEKGWQSVAHTSGQLIISTGYGPQVDGSPGAWYINHDEAVGINGLYQEPFYYNQTIGADPSNPYDNWMYQWEEVNAGSEDWGRSPKYVFSVDMGDSDRQFFHEKWLELGNFSSISYVQTSPDYEARHSINIDADSLHETSLGLTLNDSDLEEVDSQIWLRASSESANATIENYDLNNETYGSITLNSGLYGTWIEVVRDVSDASNPLYIRDSEYKTIFNIDDDGSVFFNTPLWYVDSGFNVDFATITSYIVVVDSASPVDMTILDEASWDQLIPGATITLIQTGTGAVTVQGDTGVVIQTLATHVPTTAGQYARITVTYLGSDVWVVNGDLDVAP